MSVKIRLARHGRKKHPFYRIVVADSRMPRDGRFIEILGFYNPMVSRNDSGYLKVDHERLEYWLSVGAQPTERVRWLIKKVSINLDSVDKAS